MNFEVRYSVISNIIKWQSEVIPYFAPPAADSIFDIYRENFIFIREKNRFRISLL